MPCRYRAVCPASCCCKAGGLQTGLAVQAHALRSHGPQAVRGSHRWKTRESPVLGGHGWRRVLVSRSALCAAVREQEKHRQPTADVFLRQLSYNQIRQPGPFDRPGVLYRQLRRAPKLRAWNVGSEKAVRQGIFHLHLDSVPVIRKTRVRVV